MTLSQQRRINAQSRQRAIDANRRAGLAGLADYNDGTHTWHYDQASGVYVDETGAPNPEDPKVQAAAAATPTPVIVVGSGSEANEQGGVTYTASDNQYLQSAPTNTGSAGVKQGMNPNFYATQAAAAQFAAALGGQVVIDPTLNIGGSGSPIYAVRLPDGTTVNAGAIAQILGNDAAWANDGAKSGEIAKLFGAANDPTLAAKLRSGTPVDLEPAASPAPGYIATPLQQSYQAPATTPTSSTPAASSTSSGSSTPTQSVIVYVPALKFENLTNGRTDQIIATRDTWRISIAGATPNADVSATASKDSGPNSTTTYGKTDAGGNWSLQGMSDLADVGAWLFTWRAGSQTAGQLQFRIVAPSTTTTPTGGGSSTNSGSSTPTSYTPRLQFSNLTTGNAAQIVAGRDQWQVLISNAQPGAIVTATAAKDGGAAAVGTYGTTDAAGNWSMRGSSQAADIGAWIFTWRAGNDVAGTLSFRIVAAADSSTSTSTTGGSNGGGLFDSLISALPEGAAKTAATKVSTAVSAATEDIPAIWIWLAAGGGLLLWSQRKKR